MLILRFWASFTKDDMKYLGAPFKLIKQENEFLHFFSEAFIFVALRFEDGRGQSDESLIHIRSVFSGAKMQFHSHILGKFFDNVMIDFLREIAFVPQKKLKSEKSTLTESAGQYRSSSFKRFGIVSYVLGSETSNTTITPTASR